MPHYNCVCCDFTTLLKSNYTNHLKTNKHIVNSQPKVTFESPLSQPKVTFESPLSQPKVTTSFVCKYCDQKFKFKQSMYRHIKYTCTKNKEEDLNELVRLMNNKLENQNNQIQTQAKQIEKLMGKLEINGSFNNNTINNITLLNYKDTDVSHLTDEDYKKCIKKVCFCVMGLIEKVHFNPEKPENMNVYISNMKDKYMMIYQNNKWVLTNKDKLDRLYDDKENMIDDWIQENNEPEMAKFFNKYLVLKKDDKTMQMITDEIKLMMFNNKNLIE